MSKFNLDASLFMDVRRAIGSETVRHYLEGVLIEPCPDGGVFLVGTDGHTMLVGHDRSAIVPASAIVALDLMEIPDIEFDEWGDPIDFNPFSGARLTFDLTDGDGPSVASFAGPDRPAHWYGLVRQVDKAERFPNWKAVFAEKADPPSLRDGYNAWGLNPRLLEHITRGRHGVEITPPDVDGKPFRLRFDRQENLIGLIMPVGLKILEDSVTDAIKRAEVPS